MIEVYFFYIRILVIVWFVIKYSSLPFPFYFVLLPFYNKLTGTVTIWTTAMLKKYAQLN